MYTLKLKDGAAKRRNVSSNDIPATTDNLEEVTRGTKRPAAAASIRSSSLQNEQVQVILVLNKQQLPKVLVKPSFFDINIVLMAYKLAYTAL